MVSTPSNRWTTEASASSYRGWETYALTNGLVEVQIAPQLGGRILQLNLAGYEYLWVNPELFGKAPPASRLAPDGGWLNYGGDKLWPSPQGWEGEHQWPGPPSIVLDGGSHTASILSSQGGNAALQLTSGEDPQSGIQFSRTLTLFDNSTRVHFESTMKNIDSKPRRWGIWQVTQHQAASPSGTEYEKKLYGYCPINPKSLFPQGYQVLYGEENNPSFSVDSKSHLAQVHFQYQVGKIGFDSTAGWLAVVHAETGHAFVTRFQVETEKPYPEDTSVQFWANGAGDFHIGETLHTQPDDLVATPPYLESEVLGPYAELQPGESTRFAVDWYTTRIDPNLPVLDCNDIGLVAHPAAACVHNHTLKLTGNVGVFHTGKLGLIFRDKRGLALTETGPMLAVSPAETVVLTSLCEQVKVPRDACAVEIMLYKPEGQLLGLLAQSPISA